MCSDCHLITQFSSPQPSSPTLASSSHGKKQTLGGPMSSGKIRELWFEILQLSLLELVEMFEPDV